MGADEAAAALRCTPCRASQGEREPKKPLSAYIHFCRSQRPNLVSDHPEASFGAVRRCFPGPQLACPDQVVSNTPHVLSVCS